MIVLGVVITHPDVRFLLLDGRRSMHCFLDADVIVAPLWLIMEDVMIFVSSKPLLGL